MPQPSRPEFQSLEGMTAALRVRGATTANITISSALNPGDTLDGLTLAEDDLILVKDQSSTAENGVYVVATIPYRHPMFSDLERQATVAYDRHCGRLFIVEAGTAGADTVWLCTSDRGGTLGTTALAFTRQYAPASSIVAGLIEIADQAEMEAASVSDRAATPGGLRFHPGVVKWWAYVTVSGGTPTLSVSHNVTSITDTNTGRLTVTINADFSAATWAPWVSGESAGSGLGDDRTFAFGSLAVGSVLLSARTPGGAFADPAAWSAGGFGDQDA